VDDPHPNSQLKNRIKNLFQSIGEFLSGSHIKNGFEFAFTNWNRIFEKFPLLIEIMSSNGEFRLTVEQILILQHLRVSGLSGDQIVAGLEDMDRLENFSKLML